MGDISEPRIVDRSRRVRRVYLLLGNYYQQNHQGIARFAKEAHWVLDSSYMRTGQVESLVQRVDGVIGLITRQRDLDALSKFKKVPLVDLSAAWGTEALPDQSGLRVPRVLYDNAGIARLAAQHFIVRGYTHIALFNQGDYYFERERKVVFQAAIQEAGRTFHEIEFHRWVEEDGQGKSAGVEGRVSRRLTRELRKMPKPLAVLTPSDETALRVIYACEIADLRVPEEVAVLGCYNDPLACNYAPVPLSSVDNDLEMQGYEAARLLDGLMNHEPAPSAPVIVPPKEVVTRASTDILAVPHREVAIALRFIWQHYAEPIQTDDVAAAAGLSRYHLMRLFKAYLGRSITEEITRQRIKHAKQLLVDSDLKAWQIAEQTGIISIVHFSTTFSRIVGQAPSHFRNAHHDLNNHPSTEKMHQRTSIILLAAIAVCSTASAEPPAGDVGVEQCDVVWDSPSANSLGSMPIGNGDIGANVWVEPSGDLVLLLSKTDAYDDFNRLLKLSRIRIKTTPALVREGQAFEQALRLEDGAIVIKSGSTSVRVWADANNPVMQVDLVSDTPIKGEVNLEVWRTEPRALNRVAGREKELHSAYGSRPEKNRVNPDIILSHTDGQIASCHHNIESQWQANLELTALGDEIAKGVDPILHRTFGAIVRGTGMKAISDTVLKSENAGKEITVRILSLTQMADSPSDWLKAAETMADGITATTEDRFATHKKWWTRYWNRGWIDVSGGGTFTVPRNAHPWRVGVDSGGGSRFGGTITDTLIAGRAFSPDEIKDLAERPRSGVNKPPVGNSSSAGCTLAAWIKPAAGERGRILDKCTVGKPDGFTFDTHPGLSLRWIAGPYTMIMIQPGCLMAGEWQHVAATVDAATGVRRIYLNGKLLKEEVGNADARSVTRAYALQRFMNACAGRGALPIKFNGTIFTVDQVFDPDYRRWGGPYWWQNTRLIYWGMLYSGDYDLMRPFFNMYRDALSLRKAATRKYYGHDGAFYPETMHFWGNFTDINYGLNRAGKPDGLTDNTFIRRYWQGGLELVAMMLDYHDATGDAEFRDKTLLPLAAEITRFFDQHWKRSADGKVFYSPAQSLETWHVATDPTPEIVGLRYLLPRLLALPASAAVQAEWRKQLADQPEIPTLTKDGNTRILPAKTFSKSSNVENPELYAVFPYRAYTLAQGGEALEIGVNTWKSRRHKANIGWQQQPIQAALLGLTSEAKALTVQRVRNTAAGYRFPGFYGPNYDWTPDQDQISVLQIGLQRMFMLSYQNYPWPLASVDENPDWGGIHGRKLRLSFAKDGSDLAWYWGRLDLKTMKSEVDQKAPCYTGVRHNPPEGAPPEPAGFIAWAKNNGRFAGNPVEQYNNMPPYPGRLASIDGTVIHDFSKTYLCSRKYGFFRLTVDIPSLHSCAFHPLRSDRLATVCILPHVYAKPKARVFYWDITPSAIPPIQKLRADEEYYYPHRVNRRFLIHGGGIRCIVRAQDGETILYSGEGKQVKELWKSKPPAEPKRLIGDYCLSADNSVFLLHEQGINRLIRTRDGKVLKAFGEATNLGEAWTEGDHLFFILGTIRHLYDTNKERLISSHEIANDRMIPVGPDGSLFLKAGKGGDSGVVVGPTPAQMRGLAEIDVYSPDDNKVVCTLRWKADDPAGYPYFAVVHKASGNLVVGDRWGNASVFSFPDGKAKFVFPRQHPRHKDVGCDAYIHPSGKYLYLVTYNTESDESYGEVSVRDMDTGRFIGINGLSIQTFPFSSTAQFDRTPLMFSPSGKWMVSGTQNGILSLLDAPTGGLTLQFASVPGRSFHDLALNGILSIENMNAPAWLPELAELLSGKKVSPEGFLQETGEAYDIAKLRALCDKLDASKAHDYFTRWGQWFLADRKTRGRLMPLR